MKKAISLLLVVVMLCSTFTGLQVASFAAALPSSGSCGEDVKYSFNSSTGELVISGNGAMSDYEWEESPFYNQLAIKSVVINNGVNAIGDETFRDCSGITSIVISGSVTSIGEAAFYGCESLTSITIPASIESIGAGAFSCCQSLTSFTVPSSVKIIGFETFSYCYNLESIILPDSLEIIEHNAFEDCRNLKHITIPNSVTSIGNCAFFDCNSLASVTIPNSVLSIGERAFLGCSALTSISIPNSVTSIGEAAFEHCTGLTSITIPESVTSIDICSFAGCNNLTSIVVSDKNQVFDSRENCNAIIKTATNTLIMSCQNTVVPGSVTSIGEGAFEYSELTSINLPDSIKSIKYGAFSECALEDVYYAGTRSQWNKIDIEEENYSLYFVNLHFGALDTDENYCGDNVTYSINNGTLTLSGRGSTWGYSAGVGDYSPFYNNTNIREVVIEDGITEIGSDLFYGCSGIENIRLPDTLEVICQGSFWGCSALTELTIPEGVYSIETYAFVDCTALQDVYYAGSEDAWNEIEIGDENDNLLNANLHLNTQPVHTHEYVSAITTPATCTEPGVMTYTCICGEKYTDVIPATGHKSIVLNSVEPTCTKTGLTEGEKCSVCGEMIKAQNIINALGHDYIADVTAPTCTQYGYTTYTCSRCWDSYVGDIVSAKEHRSAAAVKENEKSATCTATGSYDEVVYCSDCGAEISRTPKTVVALGHDYGSWTQIKAPTCTAKGEETRVCERDASHKETREVAALGHNYKTKETKPTATALGYTTNICSRCSDSYIDSYTAPTGKLTLKHSARTANAIKVSWNNVKTETGYQVQISTKDGKKWGTYAYLKAGTTIYTFKNLAAGNNYKFRVRFYIKAADGKNYYSPWSATLNSPTSPAGTSISKVSGAKKAFTAQWKKQSNATGYQIQYSTNAKFSKAKVVTIKSNKTLKYTLNKLSAKKTYYVRIRTYKTISKVNYFSTWSKTYKVKTK